MHVCTHLYVCTHICTDCWLLLPRELNYSAAVRGYFSRSWFRRSHVVVKTLLCCTRKCGCKSGVMSASCHLQPPCNGSTGQVSVLEHQTFSRTVLGTPGACTRCSHDCPGCRRQLADTTPPSQPHFLVQYNRGFTSMWLHLNHVQCGCTLITFNVAAP